MNEHESCATVQYGSIYSQSGDIIENPALIINESTGTLLSWGEYNMVEAEFTAMTSSYIKSGIPTKNITLINLSESTLSPEEQCYIIRRCVEYTASGFQTRLCQTAKTGKDPKAWIADEMVRVPIDVTR